MENQTTPLWQRRGSFVLATPVVTIGAESTALAEMYGTGRWNNQKFQVQVFSKIANTVNHLLIEGEEWTRFRNTWIVLMTINYLTGAPIT